MREVTITLRFNGELEPEFVSKLTEKPVWALLARMCPEHGITAFLVAQEDVMNEKRVVCALQKLSDVYKRISVLSLETHLLVEASLN